MIDKSGTIQDVETALHILVHLETSFATIKKGAHCNGPEITIDPNAQVDTFQFKKPPLGFSKSGQITVGNKIFITPILIRERKNKYSWQWKISQSKIIKINTDSFYEDVIEASRHRNANDVAIAAIMLYINNAIYDEFNAYAASQHLASMKEEAKEVF